MKEKIIYAILGAACWFAMGYFTHAWAETEEDTRTADQMIQDVLGGHDALMAEADAVLDEWMKKQKTMDQLFEELHEFTKTDPNRSPEQRLEDLKEWELRHTLEREKEVDRRWRKGKMEKEEKERKAEEKEWKADFDKLYQEMRAEMEAKRK